ncbi:MULTISPECIES: hypothetical protein [unclassified Mycolicibacterium]|uniref:hypothetical protein n=1 Tax=unclassified Mycolicibacterium TaxID=2636767 RepID=UPI002EDB87C7
MIGVPVAVTLLSGATVPWWWHEFFDRHSVDDRSTAHNSRASVGTQVKTPEPVAAGPYKVSDIAGTSWAGAPQRWFKIDVGIRSGSVRDDSFSIDSRSDSCP